MADDKFEEADKAIAKHEQSQSPDEALKKRIDEEVAKYPRMPAKYVAFTLKFKTFWFWLNIFNIVTSGVMAFGGVRIMKREQDAQSLSYKECISMNVVCWALFTLHLCNALFSSLALCGLEKRFCISYVMLALFLYDGIVLVWAQTTYFQSQSQNCMLEMADVYYWLMGEILFFYCLTAFIVCYFFRRFCQDPAIRKQVEEEEKKEQLLA